MPNSLYLLAIAQHLCEVSCFPKTPEDKVKGVLLEVSSPTATQPGETGFLDAEMGVAPPSFRH
ncbi:unnamed protein product [Rangifer tarandus platyrhynchus]|uniref:Uncharacterized protein n=1 Tax=Rangifer tarandus platyrhynchus TaxID=3082113 RepID=A0AC59Z3A8_RANTA